MKACMCAALVLAISLSLMACPADAIQKQDDPPVVARHHAEAPVLAEQVQMGLLPALEQRLPEDPFVVGAGVLISETDLPAWSPGRHGGALRMAHSILNLGAGCVHHAERAVAFSAGHWCARPTGQRA